jgi:hypothetical protein
MIKFVIEQFDFILGFVIFELVLEGAWLGWMLVFLGGNWKDKGVGAWETGNQGSGFLVGVWVGGHELTNRYY